MVQNDRIKRRDMVIRLASGFYYQPPFYREFRTFDGQLNLDVRAQKSLHVVGGTDVFFNMWNREVPFKFTAEAYYKYMWDINPYEIDNVRTRYYANNDAVAYAYGLDLNLNGQFVEGIESFFKVGLMNTREDVQGDSYKIYYNAAGERIIFGYSEDQVVADSATILPGYIPRPTDQWITVGVLIQDRMPKFESFTVQMGLQYGSRLPYGPPDFERYKDTLRLKSYFRVDIGMSYDLLNQMKLKHKTNFWTTRFTDAVISFEVFNLLGINNVLSKQWIQDVEGKYYSIPNYLTQRRFNLKLIVRF
jgi:outer membrane receptor protein involved in Fe transport